LATAGIWVEVIVTQPFGRWVGIIWMVIGLLVFLTYRFSQHLPFLHFIQADRRRV
jgi:uncharacterized protein (DUF58 family)